MKFGGFGLVGFYGISTIVGYSMPNPLHAYILDVYDQVVFCFMAYQLLLVTLCQNLLYAYILICMICKHILLIAFLNEP